MAITINRNEVAATADPSKTNGTRNGKPKVEEVDAGETDAQEKKRLLADRLDTAETAKVAKKAHQAKLGNPNAKAMTAEKQAVKNQETTGDLGLKYVYTKAQKKTIAKEKKALSKRLSTAESKAEFSGFILNEKTEVRRAKIKDVKDGEELSLNAFLPTGQTK